jgi:hypothetical protein
MTEMNDDHQIRVDAWKRKQQQIQQCDNDVQQNALEILKVMIRYKVMADDRELVERSVAMAQHLRDLC